ncbi:hypothetical protein CL653_01365 [bacterium]|nr:hypothetical protein [bacterium]
MRREHQNHSKNFSKTRDEKLISTKEAAKLFSYTPDYLAKLAREKKVVGKQIDRRWMIDPESVKLFVLESEAEKRRRQEELKHGRVEELHQLKVAHIHQESQVNTSYSASLSMALAVTLFVSISLLGGVTWLAYSEDLDLRAFALGGLEVGEMFKEVVPDGWFGWYLVQKDELPVVDQNGLVLLPEEASEATKESVRQQFSDEVEVDFVDGDSGVITPVFTEVTDESYQFVLVPVHNVEN